MSTRSDPTPIITRALLNREKTCKVVTLASMNPKSFFYKCLHCKNVQRVFLWSWAGHKVWTCKKCGFKHPYEQNQ